MATIRMGEPVPDAITTLWKDSYLAPFSKGQCVAPSRHVTWSNLLRADGWDYYDAIAGDRKQAQVDVGRRTLLDGLRHLRTNSI